MGRDNRLHRVIKLAPIPRRAAFFRQDARVQHRDHECLIRNPFPLADKPVPGCGLEAEARVEFEMSKNDHERTAGPAQMVKPLPDQPGPDALSLMRGQHRHGRQPHAHRPQWPG